MILMMLVKMSLSTLICFILVVCLLAEKLNKLKQVTQTGLAHVNNLLSV